MMGALRSALDWIWRARRQWATPVDHGCDDDDDDDDDRLLGAMA